MFDKPGLSLADKKVTLTEINSGKSIYLAARGTFVSTRIGKEGDIKSARLFVGPTCFGSELKASSSPFTIKSLGDCQVEIFDPRMAETDDSIRKRLRKAAKNDLYHLALLASALSERDTPLRIRKLVTILTSGATTESPPVQWAQVAQLSGTSRGSTSKLAHKLVNNGELELNNGGFRITEKGLMGGFGEVTQDPTFSPNAPAKELNSIGLPATMDNLSLLVEARQRINHEDRVAFGIKLITKDGCYKVTEAQIGQLIASSRSRTSQVLLQWRNAGLIICEGEKRRLYRLTEQGEEYISEVEAK